MSLKIVSVRTNAEKVSDFVSHVRLLGNECRLDTKTETYDVYARKDYEGQDVSDPSVIAHIRHIEIGGPLEDLISSNPESPFYTAPGSTSEKRASSLDDILSNRQSQPQLFDQNSVVPTEREIEDEDKLARAVEQVEREEKGYPLLSGDVDADNWTDDDLPAAAALQKVAHLITAQRRATFLKSVENLLDIDLTSDLEILQTLSEVGSLKTLLSTILARMNVQISMTAVSADLRSKTKTIQFRPDQLESVEYYRRGASELMTRIESILENETAYQDAQLQIRTLEREAETLRTQSASQLANLREELSETKNRLTPRELFKAKYNLYWMDEGTRRFITVQKGAVWAKTDHPGFPLKTIGETDRQTLAHNFISVEEAQAQRARILAYPQNCVILKDRISRPTFKIARLGYDLVAE